MNKLHSGEFKTLIACLTAVLLVGCASTPTTTSSPVEKLARRDVRNSAFAGAALGALGGAIIGNNVGDRNAERGALIGATAGALIGAGVGKIAADRRRAFASEQAYLESEIAIANEAVDAKEKELVAAEAEIVRTDQLISELQQQRANNRNVSAAAESEIETLNNQIQGYESELLDYKNSIDYLKEALDTSEQEAAQAGSDRMQVEALQEQLLAKRNDLESQYTRLSGIKERKTKQRNILLAMN